MTVLTCDDLGQRMAVLAERSHEFRKGKAQIKHDVRTGATSIADVLSSPPEWIARMPVIDVLRMTRSRNTQGGARWEASLGRRALFDNVNLLVKVEHASARTIAWAIVNAPRPVKQRCPR